MEINILNRKLLYLIKNKEFDFTIPVSINTKHAEFILECPYFDNTKSEIKISFNLSKDGQKLSMQITLVPEFNYFYFNDFGYEEQGRYMLHSCKATESVNLALTIKETSN